MTDHLHPETTAIRGGRRPGETSLAPVIYPSSTFTTESVADARQQATSVAPSRFYTRYGNPTVADFESVIAELEGAEAARAYASGMGAVSGIILALCSSGDHVVAQRQLYSGTQLLFQAVCPRFGIDVTFVDGTDPDAWAAAVIPGRTQVVWAETPANPKLDLVDLDALGAIKGPMKVVDSTFATPLGQQPLRHGADLVLHSATKGIAGHNDATLGVVAGSADLIQWLYGFAILQGATASAYDAANALRGVRTLPARLHRQCETAQRLAEALEADDRVTEVRFPGLASHPQHGLVERQMRLPGSQISFDVQPAGEASADEVGARFVESVEVAFMAPSLGGPETLVTHPASTTHVGLLPEELAANGIGPGTIRVSVGLEHPDDVLADFDQALTHATKGSTR
ncbi:MAG TPA: aminotransferase class I/II-fold pyridoxal phosphate-dependent enzyme [Acidimicrobiales bacterium]|jgi:cystathionine beta-lyase/cystathionine gamma-synthase|nr:aminotransferase class I/II-fold pyridoxal phosphate-dependent enzyme [Acidimicrobiales bacterium]